ncbi:MAG TPA: pitrilysin family protein [Thermoanaerobaculia bacterium]|nr:pitrilysin family protein [Thermoanaerobaculia bacterium]
MPRLPLATLMAVMDSGSARDPENREGAARLTAKLLVEGTKARTGSDLAEELENLGTSLDTGADWDSSTARITFLSEHLDRVTDLLGEVLLGPTFPERELQRLKSERIADLLQIESEPRALADEAFESFLYSPESRFAIQGGGSQESVAGICREDIVNCYDRAYSPAATTFIAAGDVSFNEVREKLSRRFADWPERRSTNPARHNTIASSTRRLRILDKPGAPQSELRVGHAGLPRNHPDYFPVVVMNAILGGLFGSRINLNLREAHGYTYGASSYFDWRKDVGPFVISTAVQTEVTAAALKEILIEFEKIREQSVSPSELSLAKDYLDGVFPIRYETTAAVAAALANMIVHELPPNYYGEYRANIQAVSAGDVLEAARNHLKAEMLQTMIVGDVSAVSDSVGALGLGVVETAAN